MTEAAVQNDVHYEYRQMVQHNNHQKRLKAKHTIYRCTRVLFLSKTGIMCFWPIFGVARGVYLFLDSGLYPFLTPNGQGIPVFDYRPK